MNRKSVVALLLTTITLASVSSMGIAQASPQDTPEAELPVSRVVLFTNGVGYFEHAGEVRGNAELTLQVPNDQMNDLLQSLVLQDFDGGSVRPVRYASRDPLSRILNGYSLDLSEDPSLAELLSQARGEPLVIAGAEQFRGTLVNVERVPREEGEPATYLTIATEEGLRRVSLSELRRIRFSRPELQDELDAALAAISRYRQQDERSVRIRFEGSGARSVRVGYVREMPVWKTSYRLVVEDEERAELQAWAIFDNPTDSDLEEISLSFVAGMPISFITELYDPVYVERPRVAVQLGPSIVPPADSGGAAPRSRASRAAPSEAEMADQAFSALAEAAPAREGVGGAGIEGMAEGADTGATFAYHVRTPVTVMRHESAMIPIIRQDIEAHRLSLFDPEVLSGRPLRALRLINDTGLHLAAGTVTLFDEGGFAGNARLDDLVAGDSRLLSYAVDLDFDISRSSGPGEERVTAVTLRNGVLERTERRRERTEYRIVPRSEESRFLVIEHKKRPGFELVSPAPPPVETKDAFRFGVVVSGAEAADAAPADPSVPSQLSCSGNAPCVLEVVTERVVRRTLRVTNVSSDQIAYYLENVELSQRDRSLLSRLLDRKRELAQVERAISQSQSRLDAIHREQNRIRSNMDALERDSSLYRRYVSDLEQQENEIDSIQSEIETLRSDRQRLQEAIDELVEGSRPEGR